MKVIDLLNKIAKGEEAPRKFFYKDMLWVYQRGFAKWYFSETLEFRLTIDMSNLNDEIKIIEDTPKEDKKIKRIQSCGDNLYSEYIGSWLIHKKNYSEYDELLMNKINEIIDRLNGEER